MRGGCKAAPFFLANSSPILLLSSTAVPIHRILYLTTFKISGKIFRSIVLHKKRNIESLNSVKFTHKDGDG